MSLGDTYQAGWQFAQGIAARIYEDGIVESLAATAANTIIETIKEKAPEILGPIPPSGGEEEALEILKIKIQELQDARRDENTAAKWAQKLLTDVIGTIDKELPMETVRRASRVLEDLFNLSEPGYDGHVMGCGVEDRGFQEDGYAGAKYGWDCADAAWGEIIQDAIAKATDPAEEPTQEGGPSDPPTVQIDKTRLDLMAQVIEKAQKVSLNPERSPEEWGLLRSLEVLDEWEKDHG